MNNNDDWNIVELHSINEDKIEKDDFTLINCKYINSTQGSSKSIYPLDNQKEFSGNNENFNNPNVFNFINDTNEKSSFNYKNNKNSEYQKIDVSKKENIYEEDFIESFDFYEKEDQVELISNKNTVFIKLYSLITSNNFIFFICIFLSVILYFLSLEKCIHDTELKCWSLFYPKIKFLGIQCFMSAFIITTLYSNLLIFKRKFFTKQNIILYSVHFFLYYIDDGIDFTGNHGGYNRLFLNSVLLISFIFVLIILIIWKICKHIFLYLISFIKETEIYNNFESNKYKLFNKITFNILICIFLFLFLFYEIKQISNYVNSTCDNWDKGFKDSEIDNEISCKMIKPKICYNEIQDGLFDLSKFFPDCKFQKIHNIDVVNNFYKNKNNIILFPNTRKYTYEERDSYNIQLNVQKDISSYTIEDFLQIKKFKENKSNVYLNRTHIDINKHRFIYDIQFDENLVKENEKINRLYKTKILSKNNKEIFEMKDFRDYLLMNNISSHFSELNDDQINKKIDNETEILEEEKKVKNSEYENENIENDKFMKLNISTKNTNDKNNTNNDAICKTKTNNNLIKNPHYLNFIQKNSKNILNNIFYNQSPIVDNVLVIFLDTLSRPQYRRKFPKLFSYLETFYKNNTSNFESYQFFKYHATQASTELTMLPILTGIHPIINDPVKDLIHNYYKEKGFITAHSLNQCINLEFNYDKNQTKKFIWKNFDYEFFSPFCDPSYVEYGKETGFLYGPSSFFKRCLYGKDTFQYVLDYGKKFFFDVYKNQKKFLFMSFVDGHEWTNEVIKYIDEPLMDFIKNFENSNIESNSNQTNTSNYSNDINNKNTAILIFSDHGLHMNGPSILLNLDDVEKEKVLPFLNILLPRHLADSYLGKAMELNENRIIGGYDLHNILKTLSGSRDFSQYGEQPFNVMPDWRKCIDVGIPDDKCLCKNNS